VACFACSRPEIYSEEVEKLGKLFEHQEDAQKFIAFYNGFLESIQEKVKDLPENERPLVYGEYQRYRASTSDVLPLSRLGEEASLQARVKSKRSIQKM